MIVILKKISPTTLVSDIENFIKPALIGGLLKKTGRIERITIQMLTQVETNLVEYNALVRIEPDIVGARVVKLLNRKALNGKHINVTEYDFRHRDNDRRLSHSLTSHDRRASDRRRRNLTIKDITADRIKAKIDHIIAGWSSETTL